MVLRSSVYLIGFMGAGKSTIGLSLAKRLGCAFIDLDEQIEYTAKMPISEIFATEGEDRFRLMETAALKNLPVHQPCVCATGGGLVASAENRLFMRSTGHVIYLRARWDTLKQRLEGSTQRPLLQQSGGIDQVHALLLQRLPLYEEAPVIIDTDDLTPEQVVELILRSLQRDEV